MTYSFAIAREVPSSLPRALTKYASQDDDDGINVDRAREQHDEYVRCLRTAVATYVMPALDEHPDSVFVEDTVVAIGKTAVVTNPGHPSRRGETDSIRDVLERLGYNIIDMRTVTPDDSVICDGGDVLFTGRHLFVGLSNRTNQQAVDVLAKAFPNIETIPVAFDDEALHLKSVVSHMNDTTLLAPIGPLGDAVLSAMGAEQRSYERIRLPNMLACNVVSVNGRILAQDAGCAESRDILEAAALERELDLNFSAASEVAKCDGALTCCSVLLQI